MRVNMGMVSLSFGFMDYPLLTGSRVQVGAFCFFVTAQGGFDRIYRMNRIWASRQSIKIEGVILSGGAGRRPTEMVPFWLAFAGGRIYYCRVNSGSTVGLPTSSCLESPIIDPLTINPGRVPV
jgi:hypothetical protein